MSRGTAFLLLLFAVRAYPQQAERFSVEGRVVDDIRGEAVSNARVTVIDSDGEPVVIARSDSAGRLHLNLGEGRFQLKIEKGGYFPVYFRKVDSTNASSGRLDDIILTARRSISGIVSWRDGSPAADAQVSACAVRAGQVGSPCGEARADDRGNFWIGDLQPGRYILRIQSSEFGINLPLRGLPVFFPGSTAPDLAAAFDLRSAPSPANVQVWLEDRKGVTVEGRFSYPNAPQSPFAPRVTLASLGDNPIALLSAPVTPENTFRLENVPPGSYYLVGLFQDRGPGLFWGVQPIQVGATPLSDITVAIPETPRIPGKMEIDTETGIEPFTGTYVAGIARNLLIRGSAARPDAEGHFDLPALPFDVFELTFGALPPDTYIAGVTQDGKRQVREPFAAASAGGPLEIRLRRDAGSIEGTVAPRRAGSRSAFLVLTPADPAAGPAPRTTEADRKGAFEFESVPPGTYRLFVFDREEDYGGEKALGQAVPIEVTVRPRERTSVNSKGAPQ